MTAADELAGSNSEDYLQQEEQEQQEQEQVEAKVQEVGNGKDKRKSKKSKAQQQEKDKDKEKDLKPCTVFKYSKDIHLAEEITIRFGRK